MSVEDNRGIANRKVPRRNVDTPVGILYKGLYSMARSFQVGEGGMAIFTDEVIEKNGVLVVNFILNKNVLVMARAVIRSVLPPEPGFDQRYGLEFLNLGFSYKREIRNFVAAATVLEGSTGLESRNLLGESADFS